MWWRRSWSSRLRSLLLLQHLLKLLLLLLQLLLHSLLRKVRRRSTAPGGIRWHMRRSGVHDCAEATTFRSTMVQRVDVRVVSSRVSFIDCGGNGRALSNHFQCVLLRAKNLECGMKAKNDENVGAPPSPRGRRALLLVGSFLMTCEKFGGSFCSSRLGVMVLPSHCRHYHRVASCLFITRAPLLFALRRVCSVRLESLSVSELATMDHENEVREPLASS